MKWIKKLLEILGLRKGKTKHRKRWTIEELYRMLNMVNNKVSYEEIAKKLGRTKRAIQQKRFMSIRVKL